MKSTICLFVLLLLTSCSSGGGDAATASAPDPKSEPSTLSEAEQTIRDFYPRVPYSEAFGLKTHAEFPIGLEVQAADEPRSIFQVTEQQALIEQHFSELVAGVQMKAPFLHPQENQFHFEDADELVNYALSQDLGIHGHTLIWYFHDGQTVMPDWMLNYTGDWDAMIENHINEIVSHFRGRVRSWDVVNEAVALGMSPDGEVTGVYRDTPFYQNLGENYIENAYRYAHAADPDATLYYNDWALSHDDEKLAFTLEMIESLLEKDVPLHGIGLQMHVWIDYPSIDAIRRALAKLAATGLMVKITELDVRSAQPYDPPAGFNPPDALTPELALQQKERYKAIVQAYMDSVPAEQRGGITVWGLVDGESWINTINPDWPLLFHDDLSVKPAFYGVLEALSGQ